MKIPGKYLGVLFLLSVFASCSSDDSDNNPLPEADKCIEPAGSFPRYLNIPPEGDNGAYDPTLAGNPESGRVWMVFSRVFGPGGIGQVSTHLAYSDDNGSTWCYKNEINPSAKVAIADLPQEFRSVAVSAHWSHEVPSIAYVPNAPAEEKWQMTWHRYLHVVDAIQGNDDRQFAYGWIAMKTAGSPELLAQAPEIKLFSASGYYKDQATQTYNNSISGIPEIRFNELHPDLSGAVVLTESGMHVFGDELYISLLMGTLNGNFIVLVKQDNSGSWNYVNTLLRPENATFIDPSFTGFSATDIFRIDNKSYLLVSPVSELYEGLALYELNFETGTLRDEDNNGPDTLWTLRKTEGVDIFQSGVGTYDEMSFNSGILYGDAVLDSPQFRIFATGFIPN